MTLVAKSSKQMLICQRLPTKAGEVLVLLYLWSRMLDARFDPDVGFCRFNEHGSYVKRRYELCSEATEVSVG